MGAAQGGLDDAIGLDWPAVERARAYFITGVHMQMLGEHSFAMTVWSSAEAPGAGNELHAYLGGGQVDKWLKQKILLPATTPYIFTGLRIGIGMSWLAIVASEMLLGGVGVGFFIWDQYNSSRISDIVVALVWVGLVGYALDRLVALAGRIVSRGASAS